MANIASEIGVPNIQIPAKKISFEEIDDFELRKQTAVLQKLDLVVNRCIRRCFDVGSERRKPRPFLRRDQFSCEKFHEQHVVGVDGEEQLFEMRLIGDFVELR